MEKALPSSREQPKLLEYWKPPKAVHHIRSSSKALFSPSSRLPPIRTNTIKSREDYWDYWENKKATDVAVRDLDLESDIMSYQRQAQDPFADNIHMADHSAYKHSAPPPTYEVDKEDTLAPPWWDVRHWSKKVYCFVALDSGTNFFDNFDYFTGYDPTSGFVHYVDTEYASNYNLTYASSSSAVLRVDTSVTADSEPNASTGRFSVRLTSKNQYDTGLFIFDVKHTPYGCATWPALWLSDPNNWPANGEIDVMEAVNQATDGNQMTLHTSSGCNMKVKRKETGKVLETQCQNGTNDNAGCGVKTGSATFGQEFNANGGGVMAMELRDAGIRIWQFLRGSIPSDITAGSPDPSTWGEAAADFPSTNCDISSHFRNQSIIANIDLCGTWAGSTSVYTDEDNCPGTCSDYVANNATAFTNAYWEFGEFNIYSAS
ncbi:putative endo-1,3(4)-beta-glucanase [Phlyctema vagabunda]|uniref:Endo-1,3(4)-beta-glucanase n=1 Tax=Phlyctema vagabunda TaxID=108571 RepID=A0ABR4PHV7_9HELO